MPDRDLPPITLFDRDPHGVAAAHRPSSAAVYNEVQQAWLILRHADVAGCLRDPTMKKSPTSAIDGPYTQDLLAGDFSMLFMDDPDHKRLRGLVTQAFSKRATEALRLQIQAIADALLGEISDRDGIVDVVAEFAVPFPIVVIAQILGVDPADQSDFKRWSDDLALSFSQSLDPELAERIAASDAELRQYIVDAIGARRASPRDDLISALVAAQDVEGAQLSDAEVVSAIALLLFGGNATTTDLIGNGMFALLRHRDQLAALESDSTLIVNAVEEMLRYDPPITIAERIPTNDIDLDGCTVTQGEWLCLALTSANRDPAVHINPDRLDIRREQIHHLAFGGGKHLCLGSALARMETQIAIGSLVSRFPNIRLADPSAEPTYKYVPGFHGLADLHVLLS